jgi:hypothetical protein
MMTEAMPPSSVFRGVAVYSLGVSRLAAVRSGSRGTPCVQGTRLPARRFISKVLPLPSPALSGIPYANFL